ncbi:hypothetical protein [Allokutzneria oryzae]|uniref:DUF946 domain-containing protein n=1 Tax=Allokutzneria oryzae TaxID=1378989 RepID=A0ABV5ZYL7_9PSEU
MRAKFLAGVLAVVTLVACEEVPGTPSPPSPSPSQQPPPRSKEPASDARQRATAAKYAPYVWLAEGEEYGPMDATTFILGSELRWAHDKACGDDKIAAPPELERLRGKDPAVVYRHQGKGAAPKCEHGGPEYKTTDETAPRKNENLGAEGFYLTGSPAMRRGTGTSAPTYWQHYEDPERHLHAYTYWRFYAWNDAITVPGLEFAGADGDHEGDWERVTLLTDADDRPTDVVFNGHGSQCRMPWDKITKADGRPVVYSAKGTHASFADQGVHGWRLDTTSQGQRWDTATDLRRTENEPWWGYAGGWGAVGSPGPLAEERTGPAGPKPSRGPGDPWAAERCDDPEARPEGALHPSFIGTWRSPAPVNQPNSDKPYTMTMTLHSGAPGDKVGEAHYPELRCTGELTLEKSDRSRTVLVERIVTDPESTCVKQGTITLTPSANSDPARPWLHFSYQRATGQGVLATAELVKLPN